MCVCVNDDWYINISNLLKKDLLLLSILFQVSTSLKWHKIHHTLGIIINKIFSLQGRLGKI